MSLPRVHEDCCHPCEKELLDERFLSKFAAHLTEVNPVIAGAIGTFISQLPICCKNSTMLGAFITYKLLEIQAEANQLEENLN